MSENENNSNNEWGQPQTITVSPTITVQSNANKVGEIIGTLLGCGAVGMVAYALANYGWLEIASTAVTMFFFQWVRMMLSSGLIVLPDRSKDGETEDFHETRGMVKTALAEYQAWQAKSPAWRLAALAVGYTVAFMVCRWGVSLALMVFSSPWIAGAAAAAVGMVVIGPDQIIRWMKKVKGDKDKDGNGGAGVAA